MATVTEAAMPTSMATSIEIATTSLIEEATRTVLDMMNQQQNSILNQMQNFNDFKVKDRDSNNYNQNHNSNYKNENNNDFSRRDFINGNGAAAGATVRGGGALSINSATLATESSGWENAFFQTFNQNPLLTSYILLAMAFLFYTLLRSWVEAMEGRERLLLNLMERQKNQEEQIASLQLQILSSSSFSSRSSSNTTTINPSSSSLPIIGGAPPPPPPPLPPVPTFHKTLLKLPSSISSSSSAGLKAKEANSTDKENKGSGGGGMIDNLMDELARRPFVDRSMTFQSPRALRMMGKTSSSTSFESVSSITTRSRNQPSNTSSSSSSSISSTRILRNSGKRTTIPEDETKEDGESIGDALRRKFRHVYGH